jgi:DNA-binding beta-propeller fold protein YncE
VSIATGRVVRRVPLGGAARQLRLADADGPGTRVLVPDDGTRTLTQVTLGGRADEPGASVGEVAARAPVGRGPEDAVQLGSSSQVAVVSRGDSTLTVVDGDRVLRRTRTGLPPGGVATIDGGRIVVVLAAKQRVLELYDARTLRRIAQEPAGVGPTHVVCRDEGVCYVTDTTGESVLVFTWRDDELDLLRRFYLSSRPYGLAIDEERERIWVTMPEDNEVLDLYARDRLKVVRTLPTVAQPDAVTVDRTDGGVLVTGRRDGVLQRVRPLPADPR